MSKAQKTEKVRALSDRLISLIDRTAADTPTKLGFAVVAALPERVRAALAGALAPSIVEARDPGLADELEGRAVAELCEWLSIHDLATGEAKDDGQSTDEGKGVTS